MTDRGRFTTGSATGAALAIAAFAWTITTGNWNFFQSGLNADFYDAQARALMAGHWNMPPKVLNIEGIVEHGKTYMYYGPFPAILRMPVLLLTHRLDGRLTTVSMLLAFAVALYFIGHLSWRIREIVARGRPVTRLEAALAGAIVFVAGAGSNFLYLASTAWVYHEAELWGAALAIASFDYIVGFLVTRRPSAAVGAGIFATLAMLTRGSVGGGPVVALVLVALVWATACLPWPRVARVVAGWSGLPEKEAPGRSLGIVALLCCCVLVPVAAYAAVNEAKFGSLFGLPLSKQVETAISAHRRSVLKANHGSYFGVSFIPTALLAYFRPDALEVQRLFPFFMFPDAATVIGHVRYDERDWSSSIPATMPVAFVLGVVGAAAIAWPRRLFQRRERRDRRECQDHPDRRGSSATAGGEGVERDAPKEQATLRILRLPVLGACAGTIGVLTIMFIANRYLADFMPLIVLVALAGTHLLFAAGRRCSPWLGVLMAFAATGLTLFGLWSNFALTLDYQRELTPPVPIATRAAFVSFQQHLYTEMFGKAPIDVIRTPSLGRHRRAGTLDIVGRCAGLYESAGISSQWQPVERSQAGGQYRLEFSFPALPAHRWFPVLVNGSNRAADYLALRSVSLGRYQFGYLFESPGQRFVLGPVFSAAPNHTERVSAVLDPFDHQISAFVDGSAEYSLGYYVRASWPIYAGRNPLGGPVAPSVGTPVRSLGVTTPLCDSLERRLRIARR